MQLLRFATQPAIKAVARTPAAPVPALSLEATVQVSGVAGQGKKPFVVNGWEAELTLGGVNWPNVRFRPALAIGQPLSNDTPFGIQCSVDLHTYLLEAVESTRVNDLAGSLLVSLYLAKRGTPPSENEWPNRLQSPARLQISKTEWEGVLATAGFPSSGTTGAGVSGRGAGTTKSGAKGRNWFVFDGFVAKFDRGNIVEVSLGLPCATEEETTGEIQAEIEKSIERRLTGLVQDSKPIRYGAGALLVLVDAKLGQSYAVFTKRTANAPRAPNCLDIGAGVGDCESPECTIIKEGVEEVVVFNSRHYLRPRFQGDLARYNEFARGRVEDCVRRLGIRADPVECVAELVPLRDAASIVAPNPYWTPVRANIAFEERSIEFVTVLRMMLPDGTSISDYVLKDTEHAGNEYLGRESVLVGLHDRKLIKFRQGQVQEFPEAERKGYPLTTKVKAIRKHWDQAALGVNPIDRLEHDFGFVFA
jgi:hypothetical protein